MDKRITITDVARQANVSTATVSKILNEKDQHISPQTREHVLEVVSELGYVPNAAARLLKDWSSKTLGLLIPDISNAFPEMAQGAQDEAFQRGYTMFFCNTASNPTQEKRFLDMLMARMVDGIIYISSNYETSKLLLSSVKVPVVAVDRSVKDMQGIGSVRIDNVAAMVDVAHYIVDKGCKKIGYITADINQSPSGERYAGFIKGLEEKGIRFSKRLHYSGTFSVETGHVGAMSLLQREPDIDCIVCGNDLIALGAMNICHSLHKRIPEQIKIIGFDDIYISQYLNPELTTVRQHAYEMGRSASRMLIDHVEYGIPLQTVVLPHEIVERGTV